MCALLVLTLTSPLRECMNSQFSTALTAAACSGDALMLTARDSSVDSVLECLSTTACDCGGCLSGVSPSVCSALSIVV